MTSIFDLEAVYQAILENTEISLSLHLYILVRRAFLNCGIENAEIADGVAGELVDKLGATEGVRAFHFMCLIRRLPHGARFHIQAAAGESFLILNGDCQLVEDAEHAGNAEGQMHGIGDRDAMYPPQARCEF